MRYENLKSAGAITAAFIAVAALSVLTDAAFEKAGVFPPIGGPVMPTHLLAVALAYRSAYAVLGGWLAARLAPLALAWRSVWILACLGLAGGSAGVMLGWDLSAHWYPVAIAAEAVPLTWLGGWLRLRRAVPASPAAATSA
jgi:hypothetical protein